MPDPTTVRERRLRKTKAQLIDEIDTLEQRAAAIEAAHESGAPTRAKAGDRYLANQELIDLARFPSEDPNPVLRVMPDGTVLYANEAALAVKGLLKGRKKSMLAGDLAGVCAEASRTAEVQESEFESRDRVFAFSIAPVAGETYINVYGPDIAERNRAEEALRDAEERYALVKLATRDNLFDWDLKTDRISFPIDGRERLGLLNWDCTGKSWAKRIHPDDQEEDRAQFIAAMKGEKEQYFVENRLKDDDGNWRWLHTRGVFQRGPDGRAVRMIGSAADITERKRAEEELARKEAQLQVALDNMPGGMMLGDRGLNYVLFNSQYNKLYEFPDGLVRVGGSFRDELRFQADRGDFGPGDKDELIEQVIATYQRGEAVSYEREIAGSGRTLQVYLAPTPEGGYATIVTDITERKRAESELRDARDQAILATQTKSRFLASMSHELRTPLNAIIGFTRLVMRRSKERIEPKQYGNLEKVMSGAQNLLALINDILDLAKIEAGQITIRPAEFALEAVIGDCLRTAEPLIKSDRVRLVQEIESELPKIFTDEDKVRQILLNLLSNAAKFTEEGRVTVRARRDDEMLIIEVADTGIGIPAEAQELIFEEFGQTEDGATRQHSGTGLGLAITRHLAQLLGGDITVESTPGAGSTFTVTILQHYAAGND